MMGAPLVIRTPWPRWRLIMWAAITALLADQGSKQIILYTAVDWHQKIQVTGFFNLVLVYNRGVSFSLLHMNDSSGPWVLIGLAAIIMGLIIWWLRNAVSFPSVFGGGLILGGALGNVVDRVYLGAVVDFLDFYVGRYHWPAFNLADAAISFGVLLILAEGLLRKPRRS